MPPALGSLKDDGSKKFQVCQQHTSVPNKGKEILFLIVQEKLKFNHISIKIEPMQHDFFFKNSIKRF